MDENGVEFILPVGYIDENEVIHKKGRMKLATALDEIDIHQDERVAGGKRYHDVLLLSKLITSLGDYQPVTVDIILNLFEVDFRYLQTLYREVNGQLDNQFKVVCPKCKNVDSVQIAGIYKNIDFYFKKDNDDETEG